MALFKYFKKIEDTVSESAQASGLGDSEQNEVQKQLQMISEPQPKKKRQKYGDYDKLQRAEIGKWAIVYGIRPAARKFGVPESTVRGIVKSYKEAKTDQGELRELPRKHRGAKPLLPAEIDEKVLEMIKNMRKSGCAVNYNIAIAIGKGIVLANDRSLLKENGGQINLDFSWCQSIFRRIGFTKRRATTAKQPVSPGFLKEMGFSFHRSIKELVDAHDIPDDLVINIDQTPLPFILLSKYTMDKKNEKLVPIANSADYRQVTGTFSISLSGVFLPMQIIYQGKTARCHPTFDFPEEFNITHSINHWSNEEKSIELINKVLVPYVQKKKKELGFRSSKKWLLIADVFKAQWTDKVKDLVEKHHGKMVPVPHNMTNYFQPLDLTVNRSCKSFLRDQAQTWYAEQVQAQIANGIAPENVSVDLKISILKPLHAKWVTKYYDHIRTRKEIIINGWRRSGIIDALREQVHKEDPFE